jgi:glycosyltransferase involved in cell wall biosynthesis
MSSADPTFSVVCPTYNSAGCIADTLASVLAQTWKPFELIVSDDGSQDRTVGLVKDLLVGQQDLRWEVLQGSHGGPGAARNAGIQRSTADWIAFIDSDDQWAPEKLERVAEAIRRHPDANLVCHSEEHIRLDGSRTVLEYQVRYDPILPLSAQLYHANLFSTSAVTCRRSLLCEAGLFDVSLMSCQDYELWVRMAPWIRPHFIGEVLGYYCDRPGNITSSGAFTHWKNFTRIAIRHRDKTTWGGFLYRLARLAVSFGARGVFRMAGPRSAG